MESTGKDHSGSLSSKSRRSWRLTFAALVVLFVVGIGLGELVGADRQIHPNSLDNRVAAWVVAHRPAWPGLTALFRAATRIGDWEVGLPLVLAFGLVLAALNRNRAPGAFRRELGLWFVVIVGAQLLGNGLKAWFQRDRPPLLSRLVVEDSYSFPSGHSLMSSVCFTVAAVLLMRALSQAPVWQRVAAMGVCGALIVLIAASRVWLGVHYLTDVLSGLALGLSWASIFCFLHFGRLRPKSLPSESGASDSNP